MIKTKRLPILVLTGLFLTLTTLSNQPSALALDEENFEGKLVNQTSGSSVPQGLVVELIYCSDALTNNCLSDTQNLDDTILGDDQISVTTTAGADGQFAFSDVPTDRACRLVVNLNDQYRPFTDFSPCVSMEKIVVPIWDTTRSLENINILDYRLFVIGFNQREELLSFLVFINIENTGDKVFMADLADPNLSGPSLFRFSLPPNYSELNVDTNLPSGTLLEIPTGFALTTPIPPTQTPILNETTSDSDSSFVYGIALSYFAPYNEGVFDFTINLPFGAETLGVFIPSETGEISTSELIKEKDVMPSGISEVLFTHHSGSFEKGASVSFRLLNLPRPAFFDRLALIGQGEGIGIVIGVVLGVLALAILGFFLVRQLVLARQLNRLIPVGMENLSKEEILSKIASLDDTKELGKISQRAYKKARKKLLTEALKR